MIATFTTILISLSLNTNGNDLDGLLRDYFLSSSQTEQRRLEQKILTIEGLATADLAESIRSVQLWDDQPTGDRKVALKLGTDKSSEKWVWLHVPDSYGPHKRWPLIIALHAAGGNARWMRDYIVKQLKDRASQFIVAAPLWIGAMQPVAEGQRPRIRGLGFTAPTASVAQPRLLLNSLRRRFHIDSDRVYLVGYSLGASNAWMAGVMHADCFAGIVPLSHVMQIIGGPILYPELLPNLRNTSILFCWGEKDILDVKGNVSATGGIAGRSRELADMIRRLGFKRFKALEVPGAGHRDVVPLEKDFFKLLDRRRKHFPKRIHKAFRLADQSGAYWVAADAREGRPLPQGGRLEITYQPGEDPNEAKRRFLIDSLARINARCKGQKITIRSKHVRRVILLLGDELLDLDKPVRILRGKKQAFKGRIKRNLKVMLRQAARGWDFDRLPIARVVVPVAGRVVFGYPPARPNPLKTEHK